MSYNKEIAERVRKMREFKGFSQDNLAHDLGLSLRQYQRLEKGEQEISISKLELIANILKVSPLEIFGINDKYIIENCNNSGVGEHFTVNNVSEQLIRSYEDHILSLKKEIDLLTERLKRRDDALGQ